jgi:hypothetical protein
MESSTRTAMTYQVYVVELDSALCLTRDCPSRNGLPPIYVGQTACAPEDRFQHHLDGHKSSRYVRAHGVRLLSELTVGVGPFGARDEAVEAESALAGRLRAEGYCVFGGH